MHGFATLRADGDAQCTCVFCVHALQCVVCVTTQTAVVAAGRGVCKEKPNQSNLYAH